MDAKDIKACRVWLDAIEESYKLIRERRTDNFHIPTALKQIRIRIDREEKDSDEESN